MANTYSLITSTTLGSSAANLSFTGIPSTYTDLVLKCSVRSNNSNLYDNLKIVINSDTILFNYSYIEYEGNGNGSSASGKAINQGMMFISFINGLTSTSSTFANLEIYIPSYTDTNKKQIFTIGTQETNGALAYLSQGAQLYSGTSAINSLSFAPNNGTVFEAGSSFYLYGIKNS